jgi:pimeloyl-ACP methyl ester carboxylesterase
MNQVSPHVRTSGDGAPVVLLHSSASSGRQWDGLIAALGVSYRTQAVDLHGHGGTRPWPQSRPMQLDDDIALVHPLLRAAGGVHLVGHSYGGALALKIAALHPERVRSVVVYEPVLFRLLFDYRPRDPAANEVLIVAESIRTRLALGQAESAAERFVDFWSGAGAWAALSAPRQQLIMARMPTVAAHFGALFTDSLDLDAVSRLPMPVLCLTGAKTRAATRRIGELLRYALPRAAHRMLDDLGHMGPVTHAAAVNALIGRFLDSLAGRAQSFTPIRRAA